MKQSPALPAKAGFTIVELLIVITIMGLFIFPLLLSYARTQANQGLRSTTEQLANTFKQTHVFAREARERKSWGVKRTDQTHYAIISSDCSTPEIHKETKTEPQVTLPENFCVLYDVGTGELKGERTITVKNKYNKQMKIHLSKTGLVEIEDE